MDNNTTMALYSKEYDANSNKLPLFKQYNKEDILSDDYIEIDKWFSRLRYIVYSDYIESIIKVTDTVLPNVMPIVRQDCSLEDMLVVLSNCKFPFYASSIKIWYNYFLKNTGGEFKFLYPNKTLHEVIEGNKAKTNINFDRKPERWLDVKAFNMESELHNSTLILNENR